jgi:hypothetical protein
VNTPANPAAFPRPDFFSETHHTSPAQDGMSLRDYFAGQYLQGLVSFHGATDHYPNRAIQAYAAADAMLAQRQITIKIS